EFGKIFIVVFLAAYLTDKQELLAAGSGRFGMPRAKDLGPLLLAWGASLAVLFLERDMGASLLFFGVFVVMLWVASGRASYLWIGLILLLLPIVPGIGTVINGARLWVRIGPLAFQPAEFGRILIVIFLASYLAQKRELLAAGTGRWDLPRIKDLGPLLLAWGASLVVLFLERDMGASLLLFGVFVVMVWVATGRPAYLVIGLVLFAIGTYAGYVAFSHVQTRVDAWLHALEPGLVQDQAYQIAQGWFALATGGMVGTGLGQGSPTLIPYVGSDFILAAFGEELGMLGVTAILLAYLVIVGRGLRIAIERTDPFERLLAVGLTTIVGLQVFVIAGGVLRLIPLTGVPLPLVSYGGSSRVATFVLLAMLVRISAGPWVRTKRPNREPKPSDDPASAEEATA
ncbi:MAG TPA: FtsW/RodA/SpoVE family cell cycle protein, partial [Actinomycetota bacterium]|nr:FtsW/RodA/SpoVE family cell cycle protein [Actinomycetota bacterium]